MDQLKKIFDAILLKRNNGKILICDKNKTITSIALNTLNQKKIIHIQNTKRFIELCIKKRGSQKNLQYRTNSVEITFEIPLSEIIYDFFDKLKSSTRGYASYDYTVIDYVESKMIKLDILVNKKKVDALSQILHKENSDKKARELIENLKVLIPRQMFEISIQGAIGSKILASTSVRGFRKDVTAKLYGGDVTRKMKLLKKQKEGKRKMKKIGNVDIPKEAFYEFMMPKK